MKKCSCKVVTIKPKLLVVKDKNVSRNYEPSLRSWRIKGGGREEIERKKNKGEKKGRGD